MRGKLMKQANKLKDDDMRAEYDFRKGVRGKHAKSYKEGTNVVVLDADVAADYPTAESVNDALRALSKIAKRQKSRSPLVMKPTTRR